MAEPAFHHANVKRSKSVKLVLMGGLSAGALTGCDNSPSQSGAFRPGSVYTNNYHVTGLGYYHAPFRAWYRLPYNHFDPQRNAYFYGGVWASTPQMTITNLSAPTAEALRLAQATTRGGGGWVSRGGFGGTSRSYSTYS